MFHDVMHSMKLLTERSDSGSKSEKTLTSYKHERDGLITHQNLNVGLAYAGVMGGFSFFDVFALIALSGEWLVAFLIAIVISSTLGLVTFDRMVQVSRKSQEVIRMDWAKDSQQIKVGRIVKTTNIEK